MLPMLVALTLDCDSHKMTTVHSDNSVRLFYRSTSPSTPLALCRNGESIHLRSINNDKTSTLINSDQSPIVAHVSVVVEQDPYPGFTMDGRQMIWVSFSPSTFPFLRRRRC